MLFAVPFAATDSVTDAGVHQSLPKTGHQAWKLGRAENWDQLWVNRFGNGICVNTGKRSWPGMLEHS